MSRGADTILDREEVMGPGFESVTRLAFMENGLGSCPVTARGRVAVTPCAPAA